MIIGRAIRNRFEWRSLLLRSDVDKCVSCHVCTKNCPMSLEVEEMVKSGKMDHSECILCGLCIDNCKKGAIRYALH